MEQERESIEPLKYQLKQWRRLIKYLPPTDCDRDVVAEIEKLVQHGIASQHSIEADAKNLCDYCETIGRDGEHSWFCQKCGAPLN